MNTHRNKYAAVALFVMSASFFVPLKVMAKEVSHSAMLKKAITKRQAGQHNAAIELLEQLKGQYASHKRINIELVINHIKLNQLEQAEAVLLQLQGMPLTEQESKKLSTLRKLIEKKSKKESKNHKFAAGITAYIGRDNFTSVFPVEYGEFEYCNDVYYGGEYVYTECYISEYVGESSGVDDDAEGAYGVDFSNERTQEKSKEKDTYTSQNIRLNYRYTPSNNFQFLGQRTSLIWNNDLSLTQKQIKDQGNNRYGQVKFDSTAYFVQANRWVFDVRYRNLIHYSDSERLLNEQGLQLGLSFPINTSRMKVGIEHRKKSYVNDYSHNDAKVTTPWIEYAIKLNEHFKLSIGSRYSQYKAVDEYNSYKNLNLYARLHYYPFESLSTFITLNNNDLHYKVDDPELVNWGKERKYSIALGMKYLFNKHINIGLNSHFLKNKYDHGFGNQDWNRIEAFINYRF